MGLVTGVNAFGSASEATKAAGSLKTKTESKTLVEANDARVGIYICNDGEKVVYLALGETAEANKGIRLAKESGPYLVQGYRGKITAIAAEGEPVVTYSEI